ncbi:B12-binding domain-containing radical SAM protein [bacterium]|nr:B12-binding domain-containing radical SAM protein [bacterium]
MKTQPVVLIAFYQMHSMAIRTLDAVLRRADVPVHSIFFKQTGLNYILEPPQPDDVDALVELVKRLDPLLVGLNVFSVHCQLAAQVSARLRRETGALIVWGGPHPTVCPEPCLDHADAVCIGEGEEPLLELAAALREGRPFHHVRNLWFKRDGALIKNELRPLIADLDTLPFPTLMDDRMFFIDQGMPQALPALDQTFAYPHMTARGCPFRCTYCLHQPLRELCTGLGPYVRRHSVGYVIEELRRARRRYPNLVDIHFWDDIFSCDVPWLREFAEIYRAEIGLTFVCYCHPLVAQRPALELLKRAGVRLMTMGVQSGSPRIRNEYYRRVESNEDIIAAATTLHDCGIEFCIDLILGNPLETFEDYQLTLELLLRLPRPFIVECEPLSHYPGYALTRTLLERGAIRPEDVEDVRRVNLRRSSFMLDMHHEDNSLFWDCLFYMASKRSFPAGMIHRLSRSPLARRHPRALAHLLRLTTDHVLTVNNRSRLGGVRIFIVGRLLKIYRRLQDYACRALLRE